MFILSLKAEKSKVLTLIFIILIVVGGIILCKSNGWFGDTTISDNSIDNTSQSDTNQSNTSQDKTIITDINEIVTTNINTNEDMINFLTSFGWEVSSEPVDTIDLMIPIEFSDVYINYNEIQKTQGFDLSDYKGEKCKRYSYNVLNYPNFTNDVRANILLYNGEVIGGDISLIRIDGFIHGFIHQNDKNS